MRTMQQREDLARVERTAPVKIFSDPERSTAASAQFLSVQDPDAVQVPEACIGCGETLPPRAEGPGRRRKWCSRHGRGRCHKAKEGPVSCVGCGEPFPPRVYRREDGRIEAPRGPARKWCSEACRVKNYWDQKRRERSPTGRVCPGCQSTFEVAGTDGNRARKYCTTACRPGNRYVPYRFKKGKPVDVASAEWWRSRQGVAVTYVVELEPDGPIKIGRSRNLELRLAQMQTESPYKVRLLGTIPVAEKWCHRVLAPHRLRGEWFERTREVVTFLERHGIRGIALTATRGVA